MPSGPCKPPNKENETVNHLKEKLRREEEERRNLEEKERKWEREQREQKEADRKRREEDERYRKEEAVRQQRREQEERLRREEEAARVEAAMRRLEEQIRLANQRAEEARRAAEREEQLRKDLAEEQRKNAEEKEEQQRRFDDLAAETKKREEEAAEAKRQEEKLRKEAEESLRRAEEEKMKYEREAEQQKMESERREEQARLREEQARKDAEELKRRTDDERAAFERELEATSKQLKDGIQPIVYPTQEEYDAAKERIQYSVERLHAAICGPSGSGKSSLINALRGLKPGDPGAAGVGVIETTFEVTRYPDPRTEMPYPRFIWFDVPGAGTFDVPTWQYFNQQGLFIFDFIVLVYDIRFTQIDANVLENCRRFKIPALIVRSKATQQIENLRGDLGCSLAEAREKYVTLTRKNLQDNLVKSKLYSPGDRNSPGVYIVSRECIYDHVVHLDEVRIEKRTKKRIPEEQKKGGKLTAHYIDEEDLVRDLLATAYDRRYAPESVRSSRIMSSLAHAAVNLSLG